MATTRTNSLTATTDQRIGSLAVSLREQGAGELDDVTTRLRWFSQDLLHPRKLKFVYINWRHERHEYVVQFTGYRCGLGVGIAASDRGQLVMHAEVVTRDGDPRPEMGPTRRRTFLVSEMKDVEEIE